jgi:RimJ/RimL family protein N-acetyltransferase
MRRRGRQAPQRFVMDLPTYRTQRLLLRPCATSDIPSMIELHQDPDVMRFIGDVEIDPDAVAEELDAWIRQPCAEGLGYWTVCPLDDRCWYLGWIMLLPLDDEGPEIEIAWRFARAAWGHGFASEAASRILRHGFDVVGLDEIVAVVDPANRASIRLAERIGMKYAGTRTAYGERLSYYSARRPWTNE